MTKSYSRSTRIGDQIQKELSELIRLEVKDPRVGMVTITGVDVSSDYSHAKVFITTLSEKSSMEETLIGLGNAAGFLRKALFQRLSLRVIPQLHFLYDESIERGIHLTSLIDDAVASDKSNIDKG